MASLHKRTSGKYCVRFINPSRERKTVGLTTTPERYANNVRLHIENLLASRKTNSTPDAQTQVWLSSVPDVLRGKLIETGVIDAPTSEQDTDMTLAAAMTAAQLVRSERRRSRHGRRQETKKGPAPHYCQRLVVVFGCRAHLNTTIARGRRKCFLIQKTRLGGVAAIQAIQSVEIQPEENYPLLKWIAGHTITVSRSAWGGNASLAG